jgi:hypothetical protein
MREIGEHNYDIEKQHELWDLTAHFITKIWSQAQEWIKNNPPGIGIEDPDMRGSHRTQTLEPKELMAQCSQEHMRTDIITGKYLFSATYAVVRGALYNWYASEIPTPLNKPGLLEPSADTKKLERYESLLADGQSRSDFVRADNVQEGLALERLRTGLFTAMEEIWNSIAVIPMVFYRKYDRPITAEEYKNIAGRTSSLVNKLASLSIEGFAGASQALKTKPWENYELLDGADGPKLTIKKQLLEEAKEKMPPGLTPQGCPALRTNAIIEMHDWCIKIADEFLFPNTDVYNRAMVK